METTFTFRNLEATDGLRDHALEKLKKLDKYLVKPVGAHVIFHVERFEHVAEITLATNGGRFVGHERSADMYTSIDAAVDKLLKQLKRDRERHKHHSVGC